MKISLSSESWKVDPLNFLAGFENPGNFEHRLWTALCRLSLHAGQDPLRVSVIELQAETGLDAGEVQKILEASARHGNARLIVPGGEKK